MNNIVDIIYRVFSGAGASSIIFFSTIIFSLPLGLLITFLRMSKVKVISGFAGFLISVLRGTPLMLQLFMWYYGPFYLFRLSLGLSWRLPAIIIGFSINYAAYFAEIFRSGIEGIPIGQYEASSVLGYTKAQTFRKIIFPQMVKRVIPPVTNEIITLVKDTSLAFAITYTEMFTVAKQIAAAKATIIPLLVAGVFYYIFNYIVAFVMSRIEKSFNYYK